jgi:hypothetical protein
VCACGCFLLVGVAGAVAFCISKGLWIPAVIILVAAGIAGWFGAKYSNWRPTPRSKS